MFRSLSRGSVVVNDASALGSTASMARGGLPGLQKERCKKSFFHLKCKRSQIPIAQSDTNIPLPF